MVRSLSNPVGGAWRPGAASTFQHPRLLRATGRPYLSVKMRPALSTRIFGDLPSPADLDLARRESFLDLELWCDPLAHRPASGDSAFVRRVRAAGLSVPCVHLPTAGPAGPADLSEPARRGDALALWGRFLELGGELGASVAVLHASWPPVDELSRVAETAAFSGIRLAFEVDVGGASAVGDCLRLARSLSNGATGHGVCVDLARTHLTPDELRDLGRALVWLEVSAQREGRRHLPPDETDGHLHGCVEALVDRLAFVAYEVTTSLLPGARPGEAELTMLLRRINAWHRAEGRTRYGPGASPFLPFG